MPHELRDVALLSHEALTFILVGGGICGGLLIGFVAYLVWRDKRRAQASKPVVASGGHRKRKPRRKR